MGCVISLSLPSGWGYFLSLVVYAYISHPHESNFHCYELIFPHPAHLDERDLINTWNYVSLVGHWI